MILKKGTILFKIFALFLLLFFINSCKDNFDFTVEGIKTEGTITPKYAVPLIDASFTLEGLLPDDEDLDRYLIIDPDTKFITIAYDDEVAEYSIEEYMNGAPLTGPFLPEIQFEIDPQVIDLNFNTLLGDGSIYLANPSMKLYITNYWDIPSRFRFNDFYYFEEENAVGIPVSGSAVTEWIDLKAPANFGDSIIQEIVLDTATSNIDDMISALPHHITFGAEFETDPGDPYSLLSGSVNKLRIEVNVPLELSLSNVLLTDTMDFDLNVNTDSTKVNSLTINFAVENGFPLGMDTQIYFADENYVIIDSLFTGGRFDLIPATVLNGVVDQSVNTREKIEISADRIDKVIEAKYLIPHILFRTTDVEQNVEIKLYSNYEFGLNLSALIGLEIIM